MDDRCAIREVALGCQEGGTKEHQGRRTTKEEPAALEQWEQFDPLVVEALLSVIGSDQDDSARVERTPLTCASGA